LATVLEVKADVVRLHPDDNVVVAAARIAKGARVEGEGIVACDTIPVGHKIATRPISAGATVRKYGQVIGAATADIAAGQHVHVHNLAMSNLRASADKVSGHRQRSERPRSFMG
jgi:altronate hydrolase